MGSSVLIPAEIALLLRTPRTQATTTATMPKKANIFDSFSHSAIQQFNEAFASWTPTRTGSSTPTAWSLPSLLTARTSVVVRPRPCLTRWMPHELHPDGHTLRQQD